MIKGTITSINISKEKGVVKTPVDTAICKCNHGIVGDAHAGNWHRQISLLAQESIDIMTEMGVEGLTPGQFAENLTTKDICLYSSGCSRCSRCLPEPCSSKFPSC